MMDNSDIERRIREIEKAVEGQGGDASQEGRGLRRLMKVINGGAMPNAVPAYYLTRPVAPTGSEAEGAVGGAVEQSSEPTPVLVIGPGVPVPGDILQAKAIGPRLCASIPSRRGGTPVGSLAGCQCAHPPATLYLHSSIEGGSDGLFHSCTITWQPTPSGLSPLTLGSNIYLSVESFEDTQTGDWFHYYLSCFGGIIRLSRVFFSSIFSDSHGPFLDSIIYVWALGLSGCTCVPFNLPAGAVFSGGDPSVVVSINETP